jgi:PAS domain S-box-containing protein
MKKTKAKKTISKNDEESQPEKFLIAAIGASAGGIQALKEFFENVPSDSGVAYVVILHLSPDHESRLAEVLQTTALIPVTQIKERVKVEPNHVYVVPPNQHLGMLDGHITVEQNISVEERRAPVDIFFRTLAETKRAGAIAVVLSGTGADGSMGIKRVKERGGVVFVQNPREAEFSEMPRNSIATDLVDAVLNVREIPAKIIAYQANLKEVEIHDTPEFRLDDEQAALREIFAILHVRTGHDFTNYKHPTVLRRIERRINVHELQTLPEYAAHLRENPEETVALLKDLLISVTNFFRDKDAFDFLETEIVPRILQNKSSKDEVRVWVAGCATGEEAYSLAMLLAEHFEENPNAPAIQIFATDIDEAAIAHSREGFYTLVDVADVSPERLRRFFTRDGAGFRVRRELREMILFAKHNLLNDAPFSRIDLVTCRNLLIYFNDTAQGRAMETFHFALNPGAYLFLGSSESVDGAGDLYASINKEHRVYQSRHATSRISYPVPDAPQPMRHVETRAAGTIKQEQENRLLERISFNDLHQQLLEQYAPPSIVVNENYDIIHLSDHAGRFLKIAGGEPSKNLLQLVRPELRLELRTILFQAVQNRTNVVATNVKIQTEGRTETVNIQVRPVLRDGDTARGFLLVLFEPAQTNDEDEAKDKILAYDEQVTRQLEEELERTKAELRFSIEQYETQTEELRASNEELQAINEELRSTAEELETSREELQSVNEELLTVNDELKFKIEELSISNNDFQNLLNSTDIGTIFLDRRLRVKLFTPSIREVFNLIDMDLNPPLADIATKINFADLQNDVETVFDTLQTVERGFENDNGKWLMMRVYPYHTSEDRINGVVVTFIDIIERKRTEVKLRDSEEQLRQLIKNMPGGAAFIINRDLRYLLAEGEALAGAGFTTEDFVGKNIFDALPPDMAETYAAMYRQALTGESFMHEHSAHGGTFLTRGAPLHSANGEVYAVLAISYDISDRKKAEEKLRESEERTRLLIESANDYAIFTVTKDNLIDSWNSGAENIFGWKENEIIGKSNSILFTPEDRARDVPLMEIQCAAETGKAQDERWHIRKDGSRFYASGVMQPIRNGEIHAFVKICRDQTEKLEAEKALQDKEILKKLIVAQEDERKRIARDLHDQLGQQLTALRLKLEATRKTCEEDEICGRIDEMQLIAKHIDADVDFLAWELRPAALDDLGLIVSLENYVREWSRHAGVTAEFHAPKSRKLRLTPEIETNLYRITQEALNNTHKHAKAGQVTVLLEKREDLIVLIIEDDGVGFNPKLKRIEAKDSV